MTEGGYHPPTYRSIILGILLFVVLLLIFFFLPDVVKSIGTALLYIPSRVGLISWVHSTDVVSIHLPDSRTNMLDFQAAGPYVLYTDDYDLLVITDALMTSDAPPWLKVRRMETGEYLEITYVNRGLRPYDNPFARGRPILRFEIPAAGRYEITHPTRPGMIYILPDATTGRERVIIGAYVIQLAVVAAPIAALIHRHRRKKRERIARWEQEKRKEVESFWEARERSGGE